MFELTGREVHDRTGRQVQSSSDTGGSSSKRRTADGADEGGKAKQEGETSAENQKVDLPGLDKETFDKVTDAALQEKVQEHGVTQAKDFPDFVGKVSKAAYEAVTKGFDAAMSPEVVEGAKVGIEMANEVSKAVAMETAKKTATIVRDTYRPDVLGHGAKAGAKMANAAGKAYDAGKAMQKGYNAGEKISAGLWLRDKYKMATEFDEYGNIGRRLGKKLDAISKRK